jgi:hypothetical protein
MVFFGKVNQKQFSIVIVVVLIALLITGFTGNSNSYFIGSLTPELTGICIELLIIIWVFDKWQESNRKKKLISLERRLREYLIFFLKHNFKTLPADLRVGKFFGKDHQKNIEQLEKLFLYIKENGLSEKEIISIQDHCIREQRTFENLLPVVSELTNDHFKSWCRIVYFIDSIANSRDLISKSTMDIIQNIKRFDTASYEEKLYVGALR